MSRKVNGKRHICQVDKYVNEFLDSRVSEKTKVCYRRFWNIVVQHTDNETGQHMLETSEEWSRKILQLKVNLVKKGYSVNTAQAITGMLRGYFSYHRKPLDLSKADVKQLNKKARCTVDYLFSKEDLKRMVAVGNAEERLVIHEGLSQGLRSEDTVSLTYGPFRMAIEKAEREKESTPIFMGTVETAKEKGVVAHCFISTDLLETFKTVDNGTKKDTDRLFNFKPIVLTETLQRLFKKAGLDAHGSIVRYHSLRKFLFSTLSKYMSQEYAKLIIGKAVNQADLPYLDTGQLRELYSKAMGDIVLNGNGTAKKLSDLEQKNLDLETQNVELREQLKKLKTEQGIVTSTNARNETDIQKLYAMIKELQEGKAK